MNQSELKNKDNRMDIRLADLEPIGEIKGGGIITGAANLVSFDTTTPGTTSGIGQNGALVNLAGSNTWAGNITLGSNTLLSTTYGRGTF